MSENMQERLFCYLFLLLLVQLTKGCNNVGQNAGQAAAEKLAQSLKEISRNLETALTESTRIFTTNINNVVRQLHSTAKMVSSDFKKTIQKSSSDLVKVSNKVTNSIDKNVAELSNVFREAVNTTKKIAEDLLRSADRAIEKIGDGIKNAVDAVREITNELNHSVNNAVAELGYTLRYFADRIVDISKQINIKIDSHDLVGVADSTGDALVKSIEHLTRNWQIAVNTADLKDAGENVARELSKALQNLRVHSEIYIRIDDNLRRAVLYISVAIGIFLAVVCLGIIVSLQNCRSCTSYLCLLVTKRRNLDEESTLNVQGRLYQKSDLKDVNATKAFSINTGRNNLNYDNGDEDKTKTLLLSTPQPYYGGHSWETLPEKPV